MCVRAYSLRVFTFSLFLEDSMVMSFNVITSDIGPKRPNAMNQPVRCLVAYRYEELPLCHSIAVGNGV